MSLASTTHANSTGNALGRCIAVLVLAGRLFVEGLRYPFANPRETGGGHDH